MDDEISICKVLNKDDNLSMTLFTEWLNSSFRITIFSNGATPLSGEVKDAEINKFAEELSKTRDEYLHVVHGFLSGKDDSIEFYLKDCKLRWKKGSWNQGIIGVEPVPLSTVFPDVLKQFLLRDEKLNNTIQTLKDDNRELKATQKLLKADLESIIDLKNSIEDALYKRFIIILNSKKKKIRELEAELREKFLSSADHGKSEWFDASTDDSEVAGDEEIVQNKGKCDTKKSKTNKFTINGTKKCDQLLKRQIEDDEDTMIDSQFEDDKKWKRNCKYKDVNSSREISIVETGESPVNRPSTSKTNVNLSSDIKQGCTEKEKNNAVNSEIVAMVRQPNFPSDDSEEDLFS